MTTTGGDEWRERPILLAMLGAVAAAAVQMLVDEPRGTDLPAWRLALAAFAGVGAALVAFTLERTRVGWALGFAFVGAVLVALVTWSSDGAGRGTDANGAWRVVCAFAAVAIAAPLFQTARDGRALRFPYPEVHGHAWTNVVLFAAAWAFAGIALGLGWLIASLFRLIGVGALVDLMRQDWFAAALVGAALGGAIGLLRERDRVVRTVLGVVLVVLRVLAPVTAVFLLAFLVLLPFTGLSALWAATKSTTPILLGCVAVALILANVVIGQDDGDTARSPLLRIAARVLSVAPLPLALIAAVSIGWRIAQHGLSVDRLWALTFVAVAAAYGLAYLVAVARADWVERLRAANLRLAFGLCGVAVLLALPVAGFDRIATNDQVARLTSGRVAPDEFDWAALRFDYGEPGRAAVARLARTGAPQSRAAAARALTATNRYDLRHEAERRAANAGFERRLRVLPEGAVVAPALREAIAASGQCSASVRCVLLVEPLTALLVTQVCATCSTQVQPYVSLGGRWQASAGEGGSNPDARAIRRALEAGPVEVRRVTRRQVFVGGQPVGTVFD